MLSFAQYTSYSRPARFHTLSRNFLPVRLFTRFPLFTHPDPRTSPQPTLTGSSSPTTTFPSPHPLPSPVKEAATSAASSPSLTVSPYPPSSRSPSLSVVHPHRSVLSLFARIAHIPDVDPTQRMRHRRASSSSSQSSRDFSARSRSSSRTSMRLSASPRIVATTADKRNSISSLDAFQWSELVSPRKEEHK